MSDQERYDRAVKLYKRAKELAEQNPHNMKLQQDAFCKSEVVKSFETHMKMENENADTVTVGGARSSRLGGASVWPSGDSGNAAKPKAKTAVKSKAKTNPAKPKGGKRKAGGTCRNK